MAKQFARRQVLTARAAGVTIAGLTACSNSTGASDPTEEELASSTPSSGPASKVVATAADVPVGGVYRFTDPNSGMPAYLLQPAAGTFIAYSSKCTHQGCVVDAFPDANAFKCACHGAKYDLATGAPDEATSKSLTATPLAKIAITVEGDQISVA
jgi:thiosulfate dehydrogenase [quinone] large subunit